MLCWEKNFLYEVLSSTRSAYFKDLGDQQGISISWSPVRKTSFFFLLVGAGKCEVHNSDILQTLILSYANWEVFFLKRNESIKHLAAMKNTFLMGGASELECRCSWRHQEEYNQHGVWCWWSQNWCRPFQNHDSSSISLEDEKKCFESQDLFPIYDFSVFTSKVCLQLHQEYHWVSLPSIIFSLFRDQDIFRSKSRRKSIIHVKKVVFKHLKCCDSWKLFFLFWHSGWNL